jgi:hypothetical protein
MTRSKESLQYIHFHWAALLRNFNRVLRYLGELTAENYNDPPVNLCHVSLSEHDNSRTTELMLITFHI